MDAVRTVGGSMGCGAARVLGTRSSSRGRRAHLLEHLKADDERPRRRLNILLAKRGEKQHVTKNGRDQ
jgi:hypothetical protein